VHKVKAVAKQLLNNYQLYVQPIFYPTVPLDEEMLRLTVSPHHTNEQIENLAKALVLLLK
jgi:5-aminolevulinate synthase